MTAELTAVILGFSNATGLALIGKATLILAAGLTSSALAVRQRASVRHLILTSTFGALLVLPCLTLLVPPLSVRVAAPPAPVGHAFYGNNSAAGAPLSPPFPIHPPRAASVTSLPAVPTWGKALTAIWMTGAAFLLAMLAMEDWRLRRLRRSSLPAPAITAGEGADAGWPVPPSRVELLLHERVPAPLTCGTLRPAIVLPGDARHWSNADLRRALIHELEHVRRFDWTTQLMARTACALLWFHPLAWMAWRRLALEAERACDDAVLLYEEGPGYADQLVMLARRYTHSTAMPALGMARRTDLAARVRAILDDRQQRGRVGMGVVRVTLALALAVVLTIAPLRAVVQEPSEERSTAADRALFDAAERGNVPEMEQLITAGANVNASLEGDGSPLIAAARSGRDSAVEALLNHGADPNLGVGGDGSPLIMAARNGRISTVRLLLDRGADVRKPVPGDGNPLIMAARGGHVEVADYLISRGADIEQVVPGDENALIEASASGHLPVVQFLASKGANVNARVLAEHNWKGGPDWRTPLGMAIRNGHTQVADYLRSVGAHE